MDRRQLAEFHRFQNGLREPIALEQTPLRLTFATLMLAFAEIVPPCPRSALAVLLCTISSLTWGDRGLSTRSPDFEMRVDEKEPTTMSFSFCGRFPARRMRRMRRDDFSRRLAREVRLASDDFIYPVFVQEGTKQETPVPSLPGVSRKSIDLLLHDAETCQTLGIPAIALFPVITADRRSDDAAEAWRDEGLVPRTVRALKQRFPDLGV